MSMEVTATPWTYDELQLMGIELGDTVDVDSELGISSGVVVYLNKISAYLLISNNIIKFNRSTLTSVDGKWEIMGLSDKEIRISAKEWKSARDTIESGHLNKEGK